MALLLLTAFCSLLAAGTNAQSCPEITLADIASTDVFSTQGVLGRYVGSPIQLLRARVVCSVTAGFAGRYSEVSVVAEYLREGTTILFRAHFESNCTASSTWGDINPVLGFLSTPDLAIDALAPDRRDCYRCVSPNTWGNSLPGNHHCLGCSFNCVGLQQCSLLPANCCNYYNILDGSCITSCSSPFTHILPNNTCGCPPRFALQADNTCDCFPGFTGQQCDIAINYCDPEPCMNSASCSSSTDGFTCSCSPEFTGARCEIPLDPCMFADCSNGGTCIPGDRTFECACSAGITGNTCQIDIDECSVIPSPCSNGGTCINSVGSYQCSCQGQWEGQNCERCGITNCTTCSADGVTCNQCVSGFFVNPENTCSVVPGPVAQCTLPFCQTCAPNNTACEECESGFIVGLNNLCVRGTSRDIDLLDVHIIAIVVGCTIVLILIAVFLLCCLAWTCKSLCKMGPPQYAKKNKVVKKKKKLHKKMVKKHKTEPATMVNEDIERGEENVAFENTEEGVLTLF